MLIHVCLCVASDTPLHIAAYGGSVDICRMLLEAGARPELMNGNSRTSISLAAQDGGGRAVDKAACYALLTGWQTAVRGAPVLMGTVLTEQEDVRDTPPTTTAMRTPPRHAPPRTATHRHAAYAASARENVSERAHLWSFLCVSSTTLAVVPRRLRTLLAWSRTMCP